MLSKTHCLIFARALASSVRIARKMDGSFHDEDFSSSVAWETGAPTSSTTPSSANAASTAQAHTGTGGYSAYSHDASPGLAGTSTGTEGRAGLDGTGGAHSKANGPVVTDVQVRDGKVELEGTSDTFVSYLVTAQVCRPPPRLRTMAHRSPVRRPSCRPTRARHLLHDDASTTLSSSATVSSRTFPLASSRLCQRSTEWVRPSASSVTRLRS